MKRTILFLLISFSAVLLSGAFAASVDSLKVAADSAYAREDFAKAAKTYLRIAKLGENAAVCYNLGNCYYRQDDIARAILWYERAYQLSPGDEDIRFNLDMARSKTIDRVVPQHEFFFVTWWKQLVNSMSIDAWGRLSIIFFVFFLVALAVYIYAHALWVRKVGFSLAVVLLLATLLGNACAWSQRYILANREAAIVMSSSAVVKSTPSQSGSDLFVLHEGTRVTIKDNTLSDWAEVSLADGKRGWIQRKQIETI